MPERTCPCGSRTHKNRRSRDCHLNCTQLNRHLQRGHHVLAAQEQARLDQLRLAVEAETASTSVPAIAEIVLPRNVSQGTPSAGNQVPPHLANTLRPPLLRTCVRHLCANTCAISTPDPPTLTLSPQVTMAVRPQVVEPVGNTAAVSPLPLPATTVSHVVSVMSQHECLHPPAYPTICATAPSAHSATHLPPWDPFAVASVPVPVLSRPVITGTPARQRQRQRPPLAPLSTNKQVGPASAPGPAGAASGGSKRTPRRVLSAVPYDYVRGGSGQLDMVAYVSENSNATNAASMTIAPGGDLQRGTQYQAANQAVVMARLKAATNELEHLKKKKKAAVSDTAI